MAFSVLSPFYSTMTSTEIYTADAVDSDRECGTRPKMSLFCSECNHESPVTGDWIHEGTTDGQTLRCPDCDAVVQQR